MSASVRPRLHYRALVDGGIVYDGEKGQVHHLNATAAIVWEGHRRGLDEGAIAAELSRRFAVDVGRARGDVRRALAEFAALGLSP